MENKLMPFQEIYPTFHTFIGFRINKYKKTGILMIQKLEIKKRGINGNREGM